ncbi:MAG: NAD(+) synthase [Deltaproteobacteria bacterium]|nr:NAD(+) synthase [Deltaproteobacteria bacterium]MBN2671926.1 NAD(+) synthase [Deltaproteobacteria bacterium]
MKIYRVAAATLNQTPLHWEGNFNNIAAAIEQARSEEAALLCLPEMAITGYGCEDAFLSPATQHTALEMLNRIVPLCADIVVAVGLPVNYENALYNCVALISDGSIRGIAAKQFLAGDGIHYEPRWFKPWMAGRHVQLHFAGEPVPFGDLIFEINDIKLGFEICEDAWVANRPGIRLAERGADIILNPSASHFSFAKHETRKSFVREGSRAFACAYMYTNLVGNEAGRIVYDGGAIIASAGRIIAEGKRFSFKPVALTIANIDIDQARMQKTQRPQTGANGTENKVSFSAPHFKDTLRRDVSSPVNDAPMPKAEEFARAISLGLFDYMCKSHSRGFILSLSGGADSGAVAVLIKIMVDLALAELGHTELRNRLAYIELPRMDAHSIVNKLLTCVYQATRNSSETTRHAAETVASSVGAEFFTWNVDEMVSGYTHMLESSLDRTLAWDTDDLALQNIQARVRAPGVWMLANVKGALLLSTSNRSEAAVGYATMDGDTSGGLSPIAGIDKAYLLNWLVAMEKNGVAEIPAMPFLKAINAQQPTAELRPLASSQTDESDLMPYVVLEAIEKLAIRDRKNPIEIYDIMKATPNTDSETVKLWIRRFFTLWSRNQWKRERYAPSFHLDDENLDPKTWCRFPILSGGFTKELKELDSL